MEFEARVHHEGGQYWAEVVELPGVFASGRTLDELVEALGEAIRLHRDDVGSAPTAPASAASLRIAVSA